MNKISKIFLGFLGLLAGLFALTFTVYFFNLDMKLTSAIEPLLIKHYDSIKRDTHLCFFKKEAPAGRLRLSKNVCKAKSN